MPCADWLSLCGYRLPASSTLCFAKRCVAVLPPGLAQALGPVLEQIAEMTKKIKHYDRLIKGLTETEYPETQALIQVYGVGQLTALTYVLTLGSKERFRRSRDVGCYLGLRPKRSQSGDRDPQLGITKAGNIYLRTLLVECANHVLGPHGRDSTLRQWGLHLASRGGKQSRNRAIVAVASSHLDHPGAIPPVLWSSSLRKEIMPNCCDYPASR
jgi:transposase